MNYKITITNKNNTERVTRTSERPTAGTYWELLDCLEKGKIKTFSISLAK